MHWQDEGLVINVRPHGERGQFLSVFTKEHGRHLGLWRQGSRSQKTARYIQIGDEVDVGWRARLEDHLGTYTVEKTHSHSSDFFDEPLKLMVLSSACALLEVCLPERDAHPRLYDQTFKLLSVLANDLMDGIKTYIQWEILLLEELGFALKLDQCAVTGQTSDLTHVSPKTARAVSREAATPYLDKLLPLPSYFVMETTSVTLKDYLDGLALTGYFLDRHAHALSGRPLPQGRRRFIESFKKRCDE